MTLPPDLTDAAGLVLGALDATPLELWVGVLPGKSVQLDDMVQVETELPDGRRVRFYGIVDLVRKRYEGAAFESDVFHAAGGRLPVEVAYAAHVQVTRVDPEIYVPPHPGDRVFVAHDEEFQRALGFERMERKVPIGLTRSGEPVYANLEFLDGTRGAHASISGVSGVATKTSYATFLLYSLFHSEALGTSATNAKALIFNVKGEDLLWLDRPNARLRDEDLEAYRRLGLPAGPFRSVAFYAPPRKGSTALVPDTGTRQEGVSAYVWTLREVARERLLRYMFHEGDDPRSQLSFVIERVERELWKAALEADEDDPGGASMSFLGQPVRTLEDLADVLDDDGQMNHVVPMAASGTSDAFRRRLHAAAARLGHLVRGDALALRHRIDWDRQQVTVVDIHRLHAAAQTFVVGVLLKRLLEQKESEESGERLVFVVLDELNKYAPKEGWSPIRDVVLDIAERGRSLGVSLFGAQQTASEVERRVLANASLRVVGRLDVAESERPEYGFLTKIARVRAAFLQPGTMIVAQPEIPTPVLLSFPFPAWATRKVEAVAVDEDPFARFEGR